MRDEETAALDDVGDPVSQMVTCGIATCHTSDSNLYFLSDSYW